MINDINLRVSSTPQANTASAPSENTIDLGTTRDIGEGKPLYFAFTVTTAFNTLTSLTFAIVASAAADLGSPVTLASTGAITLASGGLAAGKQYFLQIPPQVAALGYRYLGAYYTVGGSNAGAGAVYADIVETIQDGKKFYASGIAVS